MIARFLPGTRSRIKEWANGGVNFSNESINFVIGNESCDLDSAVSSVLYAWFLSEVGSRKENEFTHHIPVFNIAEKMFRLKTETVHLLQKYGLEQSKCIFRDTIDFKQFLKDNASNAKITLVDHHVLHRTDEYMLPFVKEVIDHRPQAKEFDSGVEAEIVIVGSCTTLIAERILKAIQEGTLVLSKDQTEELSVFISGPILLDTVNLKEAAGKVTARDASVIRQLWQDEKNPNLSKLFKELSDAKFSGEGLTAMDLLLKDAKVIESSDSKVKVFFSTIHEKLGKFSQRDDATQSVPALLKAEDSHLWVALCPQEKNDSGTPFKPVLLYSEDNKIRTQVNEVLQGSESPNLRLDASDINSMGEKYSYLRMYNIKASRKQILPIVQGYIR